MGSMAPNIRTVFEPKIKVTEFLLYLMSLTGIWMGISVVHLNPFLVLHHICKNWGRIKRQDREKKLSNAIRLPESEVASQWQTKWKISTN